MIEVFDCQQNTDEWYRLRAGIPTASCFDKVLAKGKGNSPSQVRSQYMRQLAGEILTGEPGENFQTAAMIRGHAMEAEARNYYALMYDAHPMLIGFVKNDGIGCSPDALLANDGLLEIKTHKPSILVEMLLRDDFPSEHKAQCQGALWVTEREWCDLICYWPNMPTCIHRAYRDEPYIATLVEEVTRFTDELQTMVARLRRLAA